MWNCYIEFSFTAIIEAHATLESDNLDEAETQIVDRMAEDLCASTTSIEQANRFIAALQFKVIAVKRGDSIVLYISCCKEEELNFLCEIVENKQINEILEQLFNSLLVNKMTVKVILVKLLEHNVAKARESYARKYFY